MCDLSSATIGTAICIPAACSQGFSIDFVTRITNTQVVCRNYRMRISDGRILGCSGFNIIRYAHIATAEDVLTARIVRKAGTDYIVAKGGAFHRIGRNSKCSDN